MYKTRNYFKIISHMYYLLLYLVIQHFSFNRCIILSSSKQYRVILKVTHLLVKILLAYSTFE